MADQENKFGEIIVLFNRPLGSGTFGDVFLGYVKGNQVAVKRASEKILARPVAQLPKLRHDNVTRCLAYHQSPSNS